MPVPKRKKPTTKPIVENIVTVNPLQNERLLIAKEHGGDNLIFLYTAFDEINTRIFNGQLKPALIVLAPPRSKEPAWVEHEHRVILVDPAVFGSEKEYWDIPRETLGKAFAYDVLLHCCIHYHIGHQAGVDSSHNTPEWLGEVNRIAPLIGLEGVNAQPNKTMRVKTPGQPSTVVRGSAGNVTPREVAAFPWGVRLERGLIGHYQ